MLPIADPIIDWGTVVTVVWTSAVGGIGVTAVFALFILGATRSVELRRDGDAFSAGAFAVLTALALVAVTAAVVFGITAMTHKS